LPQQPIRRKRRPNTGPSKNELRSSRNEQEARQKAYASNLRDQFPTVARVHIEFRLETINGAILESVSRDIDRNEPLLLDIECQGGCGNGVFLLTDAISSVLRNNAENRDGMATCQAASYNDARVPCGTKLVYNIAAQYHKTEE